MSIGSYVEYIYRDDHLQSSAFLSEWDSEIGFDDGCDFIFYIDILYAYRVLPGTPIGKGPFSSYFKPLPQTGKIKSSYLNNILHKIPVEGYIDTQVSTKVQTPLINLNTLSFINGTTLRFAGMHLLTLLLKVSLFWSSISFSGDG